MKITDEFKPREVSEFNEAQFQILRLHNLWTACNNNSQQGNLESWKWKLDNIWRELYADAKSYVLKGKKKDKEKQENTLNEFEKEINKLNENIMNAEKEINENRMNKLSKSKLYKALTDKEMYLRYIADLFGKGSRRKADDEDRMD